jgi:hypothetical protein
MLIDTKLELEPHEKYTVRHTKYNLSLLSQLCPSLPAPPDSKRGKSKVDKFVDKHKKILEGSNSKNDPQACILMNQYKADVRNLRQLHFYDESCEEDNDTDEDTI